jgi:hypothetical protein
MEDNWLRDDHGIHAIRARLQFKEFRRITVGHNSIHIVSQRRFDP